TLREQTFIDIWRNSRQFAEVRSIRGKDLATCSSCSHLGTCTRCPGLAWMEGNMRGPSTADCEKSYVRTGIASAAMLARPGSGGVSPPISHAQRPAHGLVQIRPYAA